MDEKGGFECDRHSLDEEDRDVVSDYPMSACILLDVSEMFKRKD